MVDEQGAGGGWVGGGIEGAFEGVEEAGHIAVEIADFAGYRADDLGLVGWEMGEGLGALRMLDLRGLGVTWCGLREGWDGRVS
jgi:hypothetical protein